MFSRREILPGGTALTAVSLAGGVVRADPPPETRVIRFGLVKSNWRDIIATGTIERELKT